MRPILCAAATLCISASLALSANLPATHNHVRSEYREARTADVYTGPCFANSEAGLAGDLAVMGWKIDQGTFEGVISPSSSRWPATACTAARRS